MQIDSAEAISAGTMLLKIGIISLRCYQSDISATSTICLQFEVRESQHMDAVWFTVWRLLF
jgi:hypothetical protein